MDFINCFQSERERERERERDSGSERRGWQWCISWQAGTLVAFVCKFPNQLFMDSLTGIAFHLDEGIHFFLPSFSCRVRVLLSRSFPLFLLPASLFIHDPLDLFLLSIAHSNGPFRSEMKARGSLMRLTSVPTSLPTSFDILRWRANKIGLSMKIRETEGSWSTVSRVWQRSWWKMEDTYDIRENWEKKYLEITRIYGYVVLDRIIDLLYLFACL